MKNIVMATRECALALWQAEHVKALLAKRLGLYASLLGITTRDDQIFSTATLSAFTASHEAMQCGIENFREYLTVSVFSESVGNGRYCEVIPVAEGSAGTRLNLLRLHRHMDTTKVAA